MTPRKSFDLLVFLSLVGLIAALASCGKSAAPPTPSAATAESAEPGTAPEPEAVEDPDPPIDLPAGATLGDALPKLPPVHPRLGSGLAGDSARPARGCADQGPSGATLVKQLDLIVATGKPEAPQGVLEVCLFAQGVTRTERVAGTGKRFSVVSAWPGSAVQTYAFDEPTRTPTSLPPERAKVGHDGAGWATIVATGHPELPVLAVSSARYFDGRFGHVLQYQRRSRVLRGAGEAAEWQAFQDQDFAVTDLGHLQALCDGRADATPADRAAGQLQAACDEHLRLAETSDAQAVEHEKLRARRLKGMDLTMRKPDPDPQALWLGQAKASLAAGEWQKAFETALRADVACGEAVAEAHSVLNDALRAGKRTPVKLEGSQAMAALCEPLPDKPAPKRAKIEVK
jgi:hypothetical protein